MFVQTHRYRGSVQPSPRQGITLEPISDLWGGGIGGHRTTPGKGTHVLPSPCEPKWHEAQTRVRWAGAPLISIRQAQGLAGASPG